MIAHTTQDGWWVYEFLDYSTPGVALSYIGLTVVVILLHCMWCGFQRLKDSKCFSYHGMVSQTSRAHLNKQDPEAKQKEDVDHKETEMKDVKEEN